MDKEKLAEKAKKEADVKAQMEQFKLNYRKPDKVKIGNKTVKIHRITGGPADYISMYAVRQVEFESMETTEMIAKMRPNLKLQYKILSLGLLNDPRLGGVLGFLKIAIFHPFYWRLLRWRYDASDIADALAHIVEKLGTFFFFQNTTLLKQMNTLRKKRTKEEAELLQAERESEK